MERAALNTAIEDRRGDLIVLECDYRPRIEASGLPPIEVCKGRAIDLVRRHVRSRAWPKTLALALWAKQYGLFGAFCDSVLGTDGEDPFAEATLNRHLSRWGRGHRMIHVFVSSADGERLEQLARRYFDAVRRISGSEQTESVLAELLGNESPPRILQAAAPSFPDRPAFFLPDWDDFVDARFDFSADRPSSPNRSDREEVHPIRLVHPQRLADGILVSLGQRMSTKKGMLRRALPASVSALRPRDPRSHFKLRADQWSFGDCGAFSYVSASQPLISPAEAAALYDLHRFDIGASVDHIPVTEVVVDGVKRPLDARERRHRVNLTRAYAAAFIREVRDRGNPFIPVGVIQGVDLVDFSVQVREYVDMGYEHLAIGGLVPLSDGSLQAVVTEVMKAAHSLPERPWIHLFGVYRPKLQLRFRRLGINSFDSATYFRKAWLRSNQNYIGVDGRWYAAVRVPMTTDLRTRKRLRSARVSLSTAQQLEADALSALAAFEANKVSARAAALAVVAYDSKLRRSSEDIGQLLKAYLRTLLARPWKKCGCAVCRHLGIHILIYRGINRGKRRGAHNTLQLFRAISRRARS